MLVTRDSLTVKKKKGRTEKEFTCYRGCGTFLFATRGSMG